MSDHTARIPPAAVDISAYRAAVERAAIASRMPRLATIGIIVVAAGAIATGVVAVLADGDLVRLIIASGIILTLLAAASLVMVPLRAAARHRRERVGEAASALDAASSTLVGHLSSIGYAVPTTVAVDWLGSPEPTATVPLVHDSVIAARWWRPGEGDDRVFVEPFLRQNGSDSTLPVLPAR